MAREQLTLTDLARVGFVELGQVRFRLEEVGDLGGPEPAVLLPLLGRTASPDGALAALVSLLRQAPNEVRALLQHPDRTQRLLRVVGASSGLTEFFLRHPEELTVLAKPLSALPGLPELTEDLLASVGTRDGFASLVDDEGWVALRVRYRRRLAQLAAFDLEQTDPIAGLDAVARSLADLATAALEASLAVARTMSSGVVAGRGVFPADEVRATRLAVIGMGKAGAGELNYVSDVDVIFVAEGDSDVGLETPRAVDIATRLAILLMRGVNQPALEPELWEVDPNLRPEGKSGALVRSLESHLAYYDRWAKSWEFQALLKARPLAGDLELGGRYVAALSPKVDQCRSGEFRRIRAADA